MGADSPNTKHRLTSRQSVVLLLIDILISAALILLFWGNIYSFYNHLFSEKGVTLPTLASLIILPAISFMLINFVGYQVVVSRSTPKAVEDNERAEEA